MKSEQPNMVLEEIITMYVKEFRHMYLPTNYEYIINKFIPVFLQKSNLNIKNNILKY